MDLQEAFEKHDDEFLQFDRIAAPMHRRPDVCAFLMLDEAVRGKGDMVSSAEHDQIWLNVDCEALALVASVDLIRDLARCGVFYDDEVDSLTMYV